MKDTAKGLVLGLFFGVSLSVLGGAAVMMLVVTPKTAAAIADAKSVQKEADDQKWSTAMKAANEISDASARRTLTTQQIVDVASKSPAGFTALLEPAPARSSAALQLFDVVRPGLGTMLAKFQAAQPPQISVMWVVEGRVKPASNVPGSSYCWLNASGEVESCSEGNSSKR